jgi:DegV family protein with EDD domain
MRDEMDIVSVPLTMALGSKEFRDDEDLNMDAFMDEMKNFSGKVGSASPPPFLYQEAIESADEAYIVTLSSKLSGSYENAVIGKKQAEEENGAGAVHIFDSKSAAAGETLIALKIHELIRAGTPKDRIIDTVTRFINDMKTYFVFENYDNLQKNGRMSKITGSLVQMLNIKLIMGADGKGEIALFDKCRGTKQTLQRLLLLIENSGREPDNLVITHCNNHSLAEQLTALIKKQFQFKSIYIIPTGGLSSLYADDKGLMFAF